MDEQTTILNENDLKLSDEVIMKLVASLPKDKLRRLISQDGGSFGRLPLVNIDRQQLYRKRRAFESCIAKAIGILDDLKRRNAVVTPSTVSLFKDGISILQNYNVDEIPVTHVAATKEDSVE